YISIYCISTTDCKISYQDATNSNLMMADCDNATCSSKTLTTVDAATSANTGQYTSIYCSSSTDCKIVYRDTTNENLMMADCDDATCSSKTLTTVDSVTSARTGEFNSIYCVSSTDCKISYWEGTNSNLMMADCSDASCSSATTYIDGYNLGSSSVFFNSVYAASYFGKSTTISSFDLAENYSVIDPSIGPGDMVSLSPQGTLTVEKTSTPYQGTIIGVISTKPGITLAEWADSTDSSKRPVALVGRVPVKVSDENGPIAVGDMITSSSAPGVGMKACAIATPPSDPENPTPAFLCKPGRVVGMALESYTGSGQDTTMVFINPHWFGNDLSVQDQDGQLVNLEQLREGLAQLGLVVEENGTLQVQKIVAQNVEVGSSENPSGITLYDENGSPRCVKVLSSGQLTTFDGTCEAVAAANNFQPIGSGGSTGNPAADSTPPMISLLGEATVSIEVGITYSDAGVTAADDVDGDITVSIVTVNPVDVSTLGTYTVTYNVSDAAGNQAQEVTRTVQVIEPVPAPPPPADEPPLGI
ncbi:MAG: DUF5011 domain-containing protein, partial [bacterium]|nr:DUF5011 domain-containing protein [bacterium]